MSWLADKLVRIRDARGVVVVLDPDELVSRERFAESHEVESADGWYALRRAWERHGRGRSGDTSLLVIHVVAPAFRNSNDLPYDVAQAATVVSLDPPVGRDVLALIRELPEELADHILSNTLSLRSAMRWTARRYGIHIQDDASAADQVRAAIRLRVGAGVPEALSAWIADNLVIDARARALARGEPAHLLQEAWRDWVQHGDASSHHQMFLDLGPDVAVLFTIGVLHPESASAELPPWARIGVLDATRTERIRSLLEARPCADPVTLEHWAEVAVWWGELRAALAAESAQTDLARQCANLHRDYNDRFQKWIVGHYGPILTRTASRPVAVHQIAGYLARRLRRGDADRIALLVLDGLGFAQWSRIRNALDLQPAESRACIAMIPTVTSISRQAIFAGALPVTFAESLDSSQREKELWEQFWDDQGLERAAVRYTPVGGVDSRDVPDLSLGRATGIVSTVLDNLAHDSSVLGDQQLDLAVEAWTGRGFLRALIAEAGRAGVELWITSDHGNLVCTGIGLPNDGVTADRSSVRVRCYASAALRSMSAASGVDWSGNVPGLPPDQIFPRFAEGPSAFSHKGRTVLSHGGLSLDEVFVPFIRVT